MKLVSWNVNGLRAVARKGCLMPVFETLSPDMLILQETKATEAQLPNDVRDIRGYHAFFESSKERAGYSGTAIYTKQPPNRVEAGIGVPAYDQEGRTLTAFFDTFAVVNTYFPNGGRGPDRLAYKLDFYEHFLEYVEILRKETSVLWGGDVNTAHEAIDLARPKENEKNTGFLPEERAWLDEVLRLGWIDTFRYFYPNKRDAYSYWDMKTKARDRNVGWRIDYLFASPDLAPLLKRASIHGDMFGSDHCPVSVEATL